MQMFIQKQKDMMLSVIKHQMKMKTKQLIVKDIYDEINKHMEKSDNIKSITAPIKEQNEYITACMEEMMYAAPHIKKQMDNKELCTMDTTNSVKQAKEDFNRI